MKPFWVRYALSLALLTLVCGVGLGRSFPEKSASERAGETAGQAVAAMAMVREEALPPFSSASGLPAGTAAPAPTPENLFAVAAEETIPSQASHPAGMTEPATAAAPGTPFAAPTPAPSGAFTLQVVERRESAPSRRVLIYHTHTYEAYEKQSPTEYVETQRWRTADENANVVRVGETLAGLLRGLNFQVEHDKTAFEPPDLSSAYARSLAMLEGRGSQGERYDLYIDLHRDAYSASANAQNTVSLGGAELARLMLLVGKGEGQTGQGFGEKPDWEQNLAIAQRITDGLNAQAEGLCRPVMVKSGRYNQHVAVGCVLIEVGNNLNTLPQALAAMPYLADAIDGAVTGESGGKP